MLENSEKCLLCCLRCSGDVIKCFICSAVENPKMLSLSQHKRLYCLSFNHLIAVALHDL